MKTELIAYGIDTVRWTSDLVDCLPLGDDQYRRELSAAGWQHHHRESITEDGELLDSRTMSWQDSENDTLRVHVYNAGRSVAAEFSAPRLLTGTTANLQLATADQVADLTDQVKQCIRGQLPNLVGFDEPIYRRLDMAADVAAYDARPGLIAAAAQFRIPRARKVTRQVFPGETSRASSSTLIFRGYDKAVELEHKCRKELHDQKVIDTIQSYKASGAVRLELQTKLTKKDHTDTGEIVKHSNIKWADTVQTGFSGGRITIGGLDYIRRELDGNADLSPQSRNALIAFAVRYAELGEDGMKAAYSKPTFYRQKKKFLETGLRLEDVSTYSGEIDLVPVISAVRSA